MSVFILIGLLLSLAALGYVLYPIFRPASAPSSAALLAGELQRRRRDLYAQILDLELDQRLGKLDEADALDLTEVLLSEAAKLLAQESSDIEAVAAEIEHEIQTVRVLLTTQGQSVTTAQS